MTPKPRKYAEDTKVPVARSQSEVQEILRRFGASGFMCGWDNGASFVTWAYRNRVFRYSVQIPENEREERRLWRTLTLCIKAKVAAVDDGLRTFEEEFLSAMVMPDGKTLGETVIPQIEKMGGKMPAQLLLN